ncbi:MAG: HAD family hydrolase [Aestuariibacter sp.]|nr:HAD family hydrolase [Aestuariibacter sp.]MCP4529286.1 HAD family hydrolase [Aestuariibacter sp.]MCP5017462.1 HAD family hydrolase [Ketobacter sp.]
MTHDKITTVCFDAFGTLIQRHGHRINPYRHLIQRGQDGKYKRLPFLTRNVGISVFAEELGLSHMLPVIQQELADEIASLRLFPEVDLTLRKLRATGKRITVCSNLAAEYGATVRQLLPNLDAYVLSYEVGAAKPDPVIYDAVCTSLKCHPRDVLFIGDSKRCDKLGPEDFGMRAKWLDRNSGLTLIDTLLG